MQLPTDWPGLFAAAGFQLGTVRDIQAQTLPTWQHVQAVYRQYGAQIRVRYGRRLGPGIARRIDRQVAQVAAAIRRRDQTLRQLPGAERDSAQHAADVPPGRASVGPRPAALRRSACPPAAGLLPWPERARRRCRDTGRCRGPAAVTARARPAERVSAEPQSPARQP
jgi:hypothetical protein